MDSIPPPVGEARSVTFRCPQCRGALAVAPASLRCAACGATYAVEDGIADFSAGRYYDVFESEEQLTAEHRLGLAAEIGGSRWRIERYYAPRLERGSRVLDCGCGNGVSVDVLMKQGFDAWGIDLSALRKWQWRERRHRDRLAVASALRLPFGDGEFDAVISSGVIEHIGVAEEGGAVYRVSPLPDRDQHRRTYVSELLRVTSPGGRVFVDCPNGAFPIDFWHGPVGGRARWHRRDEGFLPNYGEIERCAREIEPRVTIRAQSPHRRFAFRQVSRHWYGRMLAVPASLFLAAAGRLIAGTPLNPYLVVEIQKPPVGGFERDARQIGAVRTR